MKWEPPVIPIYIQSATGKEPVLPERTTQHFGRTLMGRPLHIWKVPYSPPREVPAKSRESNLGQCVRCHNICGFNQCCEAIWFVI
jgi:hypothetical protein